jgi:hypothetical protein
LPGLDLNIGKSAFSSLPNPSNLAQDLKKRPRSEKVPEMGGFRRV